MNYIGSKNKLSTFITSTIEEVVYDDLSQMVVCDLFAGTGIIGRNFKPKAKQIISNDLEYYSFVLNRNYIGNNQTIANRQDFVDQLNAIMPFAGFIYTHYCKGGHGERHYFSDENGKKIDAIRMQIEDWKTKGAINEDLYYFLLASLLESADKVANTASVYGAYLKKLKKSAQVVVLP
jgi:adenine-specific DNA-methyltransferase